MSVFLIVQLPVDQVVFSLVVDIVVRLPQCFASECLWLMELQEDLILISFCSSNEVIAGSC